MSKSTWNESWYKIYLYFLDIDMLNAKLKFVFSFDLNNTDIVGKGEMSIQRNS